MIDPNAVTDTARTVPQLEEFLLFCVVVAGKNADQQSRKLEAFLRGREPFRYVRSLGRSGALTDRLKEVRLGKYTLLAEAFARLAASDLDLRACPWSELTAFPGIGIKTAKFFVLHSRPGEMHGVLDTHVLSWIGERWKDRGPRGRRGVPRHSPQDPALYAFWETVYFGLMAARHHARGSVPGGPLDWAQVDLDLWRERREKI
jgi:hypothetical protein